MNKKNIILSLFIGTLLTFVMPLCAQNQTVTGLVVDVSGEPIIGATVMVVNGTVGTVTDIDGKFNIKVAPKSKLKVSFVGYTSQIISDLKNPRIVLLEDQLKLDEVVVLGDYGSQKLRNATGAIETISTEELKDLSVGSLGDALAGKINGLHVSLSGGRPGSTPSLQIRQSSVNTTITPSSDLGVDLSHTQHGVPFPEMLCGSGNAVPALTVTPHGIGFPVHVRRRLFAYLYPKRGQTAAVLPHGLVHGIFRQCAAHHNAAVLKRCLHGSALLSASR